MLSVNTWIILVSLPLVEHFFDEEEASGSQSIGTSLFNSFTKREAAELFNPDVKFLRPIDECLRILGGRIDEACYKYLISEHVPVTRDRIDINELLAVGTKGKTALLIPTSIAVEVNKAIHDRYQGIWKEKMKDTKDKGSCHLLSTPIGLDIYDYNDLVFKKDEGKNFIFAIQKDDFAFISTENLTDFSSLENTTEKLDPARKIKFSLKLTPGMTDDGRTGDYWQLETHYKIKQVSNNTPLVFEFPLINK